MKVSILVPYFPAGPEREAIWEWVERRWAIAFPDAEVVLGSPDDAPDPGRFCRAVALNRAAARASGDVLVIADADTACERGRLREATVLCHNGHARWVLPDRYVRLSERLSALWMTRCPDALPPACWESEVEEEWPANVSGIVVLPRGAFERVGGFDERFRGWGWEDGSFACSLETLWGPPVRLRGMVAWHLWHPRPPEHSIHGPWAVEQRELGGRYVDAAGNPATMAALLAERP